MDYTCGNCINFTFHGYLTASESERSTMQWCSEMENNPEKKYHFIWDCTHMSGFEPDARKQWYISMSKYKSRISKVTVIANNIIIRGAARVMLAFFNIEAEIKKSKDIKVLI